MPTEAILLEQVLKHDLCIACGACVAACPHTVIVPHYSQQRGAHEVRVTETQACASCTRLCEAVCPSLTVRYAALLPPSRSTPASATREGTILQQFIGYAPAYHHDGTTSSGGIIRALISHALSQAIPVVCLGRTGEESYHAYGPMLLTSPADVSRVPGSIYHSVSFVSAIPLLHALDTPALLVATPCQLEGIYAYAATCAPALREKIALTVGLICGWMYSDHAIRAFAEFQRITEAIRDVQYRGEDKVGYLKMTTADATCRYHRRGGDGPIVAQHYRTAFATEMNRLRCRVCQNHLNILADIAVGDAWLAREASRKTSVLLIRSTQGQAWVEALTASGELQVEPGHTEDLVESQSADLVYGFTARRVSDYLRRVGIQAPAFAFEGASPTAKAGTYSWAMFLREHLLRTLARQGRYTLFRALYRLSRAVPRPYRAVVRFVCHLMGRN